jgi:hypothetical protein
MEFKKAYWGSLFFTEDFLDFGAAKAVAKVLERLVDQEAIARAARGIYTQPRISKALKTTPNDRMTEHT